MGKKMAKTPGAPAASRTKKTPLAPTMGNARPSDMSYDDVSSADVYQAGIRAKVSTISGNDSALGQKGTRGRTATNASAQFRITATKSPFTEERYPGTQANGRIMPSVMGQAQNFNAGGSTYGPM
jgi:hypothetical protein